MDWKVEAAQTLDHIPRMYQSMTLSFRSQPKLLFLYALNCSSKGPPIVFKEKEKELLFKKIYYLKKNYNV